MKPFFPFLLALPLFAASLTAHADMIYGLYTDADAWRYDNQLEVAQAGTQKQSFKGDTQTAAAIQLAIEHPLPFVPNIKLRYVPIELNAHTNTAAFVFNNTPYAGSVDLSLSAKQTDLILYYELLDNIVSVDAGIAAKQLKGDITVSNLITKDRIVFNETLPLVYLAASVKLPFTGLSVNTEGTGIQYQGSSLSDLKAEIRYDLVKTLPMDIGLKLGYRKQNINLKDIEHTDAKLDVKGPYLGLGIHF